MVERIIGCGVDGEETLRGAALARKLAVIMHRMWIEDSEFRWSDKASTGAH